MPAAGSRDARPLPARALHVHDKMAVVRVRQVGLHRPDAAGERLPGFHLPLVDELRVDLPLRGGASVLLGEERIDLRQRLRRDVGGGLIRRRLRRCAEARSG